MKNRRFYAVFFVLFCSLILTACSFGSSVETTTVGGLEIIGVTYSKGFSEEEGPIEVGNVYYPTDTILVTIEIKGRPENGIVLAEAYWKDQFISSATVDINDVNEGMIFSIGENTYSYITLTPDSPFPISDNYYFAIYVNEEKLGDFPFEVIPPSDAIPSSLEAVTLAKDVDQNFNPINPTTSFTANEPVVLVANGDIGRDTWFNIIWEVSGLDVVDCNTIIKADQDYPDDGLYFLCSPETAWPLGEHSVSLFMNDAIVGTYPFTVE